MSVRRIPYTLNLIPYTIQLLPKAEHRMPKALHLPHSDFRINNALHPFSFCRTPKA
ncbi:hypothetical protein D1AOALGA4SA_1113 [Olavius algarvensis Delta 1 endosymbiont]|nr:hypothetical protein D1AOALGA4SA_1113 [Olavius algarvensis Delta 1 endosymbiont]